MSEQKWLQGRIELFEYPVTPYTPATSTLLSLSEAPDNSGPTKDGCAESVVVPAVSAELERRLADETHRAFEGGRERGRQEGRQLEREAQAGVLKAAEEHCVRQTVKLLEDFVHERDRYMHEVEHEVVKLALAVAARILRREAQIDPLLLTGAVRVALGQLSGSTEVRVRVPPGELELWQDAMALLPNLALKPAVIAGEGMRLGDCVIETALGSVDLGIRSQLGEIEHGFFDGAVRRGTESSTRKAGIAPAESHS